MAEERIQKIMSEQGLCSRRAAEQIIAEGRVKVNGHAGKRITPMDKKFCFDALAEEGFQPEIDEDGDISFLAGEISLSLILDEEDKDFFSLVCAFEVDDMDQLELFYSAASEASREYRIAKAYIGEIEDECFEIRFCVEGLATPELFRSNLRRYVELLLDMQESVFDACEEDDSDAE